MKDWACSARDSSVNQNDGAFFPLLTCIILAYAHTLPGQEVRKGPASKATIPKELC